MSRKDKKIARLKKDLNFYKYAFERAQKEIEFLSNKTIKHCIDCKIGQENLDLIYRLNEVKNEKN